MRRYSRETLHCGARLDRSEPERATLHCQARLDNSDAMTMSVG
jgi:hypothetical protein